MNAPLDSRCKRPIGLVTGDESRRSVLRSAVFSGARTVGLPDALIVAEMLRIGQSGCSNKNVFVDLTEPLL